MNKTNYLNNQFIIAMPMLTDPNFFHTVAYLCQHSEEGALGIIINRATNMKLGEVFKQMNISVATPVSAEAPVYAGGPVHQERGFVVHTSGGDWQATMAVSENISLTTSRDVLEAIASGEGPEQYLVALGYAGWGAGQLENEIMDNAWLNSPCSKKVMFDTPVHLRWAAAAQQIGIDINRLTTLAGHG